jgi:molybdenum cofactor cytidylyltransferase
VKFGPVALAHSIGGIVAHAVRREGLVLKKGDIVRAEHVPALEAAGISEIVLAQPEPGDVGENPAALRLAEAIAGAQVRVEAPFTGRSNLFATVAGMLTFDAAAIDRINDVDEMVTVATLPAFRTVEAGEMIATVKIIPFAIPGRVLDKALQSARDAVFTVVPFRPLRVGVVSTLLPGLKPSVIDKTLRVLQERLAPASASIVAELRVAHDEAALTQAITTLAPQSDLIIVFGASAITDRRDVIPAALELAGGRIVHFGMPVDPGNLLLIGALAQEERELPVLGAPGCARSPKENGFDWVLHRLLAGLPVSAADIKRMGVGGLLMEIISRGQPRTGEAPHPEPSSDD